MWSLFVVMSCIFKCYIAYPIVSIILVKVSYYCLLFAASLVNVIDEYYSLST